MAETDPSNPNKKKSSVKHWLAIGAVALVGAVVILG